MLVCNVSQRARRVTIAAEVAETAAAIDILGFGNIVFATLVDDPASVIDVVDAYIGEIMLEAASATDSFDAGMVYGAAVDEAVTALDQAEIHDPNAVVYVYESASADSSQDAIGGSLNVPIVSASRAGLGAVVVGANAGKAIVISNVGAVS